MAKSLSRQAKQDKTPRRPAKETERTPPERAPEPIPEPVVEAVAPPPKPKRVRFVREKKEKRPEAKKSTTTRSTTAGGKMMSKNVKPPAKQKPVPGKRPEGVRR